MKLNLLSPSLGSRVMRRIYAIWLARWLTGATIPKLVSLVVFSWLLARQVSSSSILLNAAASYQNLFSLPQFLASAFLNTEMLVKLLVAIFGITAMTLFLDLYRRWPALVGRRRIAVMS